MIDNSFGLNRYQFDSSKELPMTITAALINLAIPTMNINYQLKFSGSHTNFLYFAHPS